MEGVVERLRAPTASFLDVGSGVGALAIELCRIWPHLRVVGLVPQAVPLAEGQRNVAAAGPGDRIELRAQRVEQMTEHEAFDLAQHRVWALPYGRSRLWVVIEIAVTLVC